MTRCPWILWLLWAVCTCQPGGIAPRAAAAEDTLQVREERAIKAAIARVAPSVVRIETVGGLERIGELMVGTGPTTGLVVSDDGFIISSAFNFIQKPDSILVTLEGGTRHAAKLVATDHSRLLVLLKVESPMKLTVPEPVPQSEMRVGQWALALGRTFETAQPNASVGIVSAVNRIWGKAIQTDAKISPNNYGGPLVDISGRVLGVLVPMSPQGNAEVAGIEWYDSGIGFAVPLETVMRGLAKMRGGHDLHAGVLGISMKGKDVYGDAAVIGAARPSSPAYKAGFRTGDTIVEAGGKPITRQSELKHQLGPLYAGDKITLVATRGEQRISREVELVEKIEPFEPPFLGILPMRPLSQQAAAGLTVRYVYPESPAATAGIKPGDRIQKLAGAAVENAESARQQLAQLAPGKPVQIEVLRGSETLVLEPQLAALPETLPVDLPPAHPHAGDLAEIVEGEKPTTGIVPLAIPEFENKCVAYVPETYHPRIPHGLVVWLHAPGGLEQDKLVELWKPLCEKDDLIILAPSSSDAAKWQLTEAPFVRRVLDEVIKNYTIDPTRIAAHGYQGGAAMAYVVGLSNTDVVRAIAAADAPLPRGVQPPEGDPTHPLAFYTTLATKAETTPAVEAGIKKLRDMKYPVVVKNVGEQARYLTAEEMEELARWFDSLDRL